MFRSFYSGSDFSFVVFVVAVLLAQNAMFSYMLSRTGYPGGPSPNNVAAIALPISDRLSLRIPTSICRDI